MEEAEVKTKKETLTLLTGIERIDPFFAGIMKNEEKKSENKSDDFTGKGANRKLDKKWNIKMQFGVDFFTDLFTFLKEMECETVLGFTKQTVKIYVIDPSGTHFSLTTIDKTEISEYINIDITSDDVETIVYVEFDILEEMSLNSKYPIDIYFDTKENHTMYIVNGKAIESRRLKNIDEQDKTIATYKKYPSDMLKWLKNEEGFIMNVSYVSFVNTLKALEKKKGKKDKSAPDKIVKINFGKTIIDFRIESEIKASEFQMSGDDIAVPGSRDTSFLMSLEMLVKLAKLKFKSNAIIHLNENLPIIIETKFGAGKIHLYYIMSPRVEGEEQTTNNENKEQSSLEE